jgi:hypothetical protein
MATKKKQIGDHASPQRGFGLGTPEGAEGGGQRRATPGNTRRGQQRERAQATVHQTSSKHTCTSRHGRISNRSPNQKDIAGRKRAHSNRNRTGRSGQEAERIQEPTACKSGGHLQGQKSQDAEPCARARPRQRHKTRDPRDQVTKQ